MKNKTVNKIIELLKHKHKRKTLDKRLENKLGLWLCILVVGGGLVMLSVYVFFAGFHNIDLSYNILKLSYQENQTYYEDYCDITNYGNCVTYSFAYRMGLAQIFRAGWFGLFGAFIIGISLAEISRLSERRRNIK